MTAILHTLVPVFAIVALGWWLAGSKLLDASTLTRLTVGVCAPALVLDVFVRTRWADQDWGVLVGGTVFVMVATAALALANRRVLVTAHRGMLLPVVFWNSGNMGLSIVRLGLGEAALPAAAVVFVTVATANAIAGPWIAAGRGGLSTVVRMPLMWASVLGVSLSGLGVGLPQILAEPVSMLGAAAIPLMLLTLGMTMRGLPLVALRDAACLVGLRMGGGLLAVLVFLALVDTGGIARQVLLLEAVLPPAIINVLFARTHGAAPETVASAILLGTLASIVVLPVMLAVVL